MGALRGEVASIADLLADFGTPGHPSPADALQIIGLRFDLLMAACEFVASTSEEDRALVRAQPAEAFVRFVRASHHTLFVDLLRNAGDFRAHADAGGSGVVFGGQSPRELRPNFHGAAPELIEPELLDAFAVLAGFDDPVRSSILSYQRFQQVHPFYDANGRIGRLFVTLYLAAHGLYPQWALLDQHHGRFVQYLNHVHKRALNDPSRVAHEDHLVRFWRKHVLDLDDFYREEVE